MADNQYVDAFLWVLTGMSFLLFVSSPAIAAAIAYVAVWNVAGIVPGLIAAVVAGIGMFVLTAPHLPGESG